MPLAISDANKDEVCNLCFLQIVLINLEIVFLKDVKFALLQKFEFCVLN